MFIENPDDSFDEDATNVIYTNTIPAGLVLKCTAADGPRAKSRGTVTNRDESADQLVVAIGGMADVDAVTSTCRAEAADRGAP